MKASEILQYVYFVNFNNLNILECGAGEAQETGAFCSNNNCYYIEAWYDEYIELKKKKKNVVNYALSDNNNNVEFVITSHGGNSSVSHSDEHKHELLTHYNSTFTKTIVPATTYKNYIENIIKVNIDILILDIEGHECTVLNTFRDLKFEQLPKIICIECGYDWIERKKILIELGYILDFYEFNNCYLTHSRCNIMKNLDNIKIINNKNKKFIWHDIIIYENELNL
jgi:FkbM family methyltransferase